MSRVRFRSNLPDLRLTVRPASMDGFTYDAGNAIQFRNGEYRTTDRKTISFLRGHELFGLKGRGFWEESPVNPGMRLTPTSRPAPRQGALP